VLADLADDIGLDAAAFAGAMADPAIAHAVDADRRAARLLQVRSIPALIIRDTGARLVNGPVEDLRAQIRAATRLSADA